MSNVKAIMRSCITDIGPDYHPTFIVNASNATLTCGGGVSGAIHEAHHFDLEELASGVDMLSVGGAVAMNGGVLCEGIIQTVAPSMTQYPDPEVWRELLEQCYRSCLQVAERYAKALYVGKPDGPTSLSEIEIAFPLLGTGAYRLPEADADRVAADTCSNWNSEMQVTLVVHDRPSLFADTHNEAVIRLERLQKMLSTTTLTA